jgi:putative ABC transport system ATP-binding protein
MADPSTSNKQRIEVRDLAKSYKVGGRRIDALRGVDLTIEEPGFYGVMGASGSGKSTLLHLLSGLDNADRGTMVVGETTVNELDEQALTMYRRRRVGVIFQKFNLLPTLTALENVVLPGVLDKLSPGELDARGRSLLEDMGLSDRADHRPDALSGGEQQRVAIARALFFSPAILFADEPTGNLDMVSSDRLWSVLERLAGERNMIVLMVTHEAEAAARCRQVFVLRDGQNAGVIDAEELDPSELAARAASVARPV